TGSLIYGSIPSSPESGGRLDVRHAKAPRGGRLRRRFASVPCSVASSSSLAIPCSVASSSSLAVPSVASSSSSVVPSDSCSASCSRCTTSLTSPPHPSSSARPRHQRLRDLAISAGRHPRHQEPDPCVPRRETRHDRHISRRAYPRPQRTPAPAVPAVTHHDDPLESMGSTHCASNLQ
ncbi:unnamed protein product, partial [Urochloa humidicola]